MTTEPTSAPDFSDFSHHPRAYALRTHGSKYPFIALYTSSFPASGHAALDARHIAKKHVDHLNPSRQKDFSSTDARFYDTWTKLTAFSLTEFDRVVLLDCDMLVRQNMDELMDEDGVVLDDPELEGEGGNVFAAAHACVCNPLRRKHYPANWVPENCAYTHQHADPSTAQTVGLPCTTGLGTCNSGLLVVRPSKRVYAQILETIDDAERVARYDFPDQELLSDWFRGRWVALPYVYNALKTLRRPGVHDAIWRDERVKNVHYILVPKPWDDTRASERGGEGVDEMHEWWWRVDAERIKEEEEMGIKES
ncbi:MAG: hypothetical protein M1816_007854 [Peltula sp. TS41687]|nr:MAG: hypothetical protein M1816_007854 [Peltula sp. TS41687]